MMEKEQYLAFHVRVGIPMSLDAATTSPVESLNRNIKEKMGCQSNNHISTTMVNLACGSNRRIQSFINEAERELQYSSLCSKLFVKDDINRNCLYLCNQNYDNRRHFHLVQSDDCNWIVWNFYEKECVHDDDDDASTMIPRFLEVFHVGIRIFCGNYFLKCDCMLYERCGIPCTHVLRVTNDLSHTMIKIQHWKVFATHYGSPTNSKLGEELIKAQMNAHQYDDMGVPVPEDMIIKAKGMNVSKEYPFLYDGTTYEDYHEAQFIESHNNSLTINEWKNSKKALYKYDSQHTFDQVDSEQIMFDLCKGQDESSPLVPLGDILVDNNEGRGSPLKRRRLFDEFTNTPTSEFLNSKRLNENVTIYFYYVFTNSFFYYPLLFL